MPQTLSSYTSENRPWTRWWWLGSALDEAEIARSLAQFREAGIGGVEISPIYGVRGYEERWTSFLSPRWVELLRFTIREARRLDMGVDLIAGTGWPYGGPWVSDDDSPRRFVWKTIAAAERDNAVAKPPTVGTSALIVATTPDTPAEVRQKVDLGDAAFLAAMPPDANGDVLGLFLARTRQQVKRAAPGGEGNVLDHFSGDAVARYLHAFDDALSALADEGGIRCFFNDSYEVFGANATPALFDVWRERRGYDPISYLRALHGSEGDAELIQRVRSDYRETVGDLLREAFVGQIARWAQAKGAKFRHQAHGSPGNLLDLYALADIPETEVFGPIRLAHSGLHAARPVTPDFDADGEELLVCKMASSAAHVAGRPLCSSESFTWMGEHGCVPLEHAKAEVDLLFVLGVNHVFFHGTPSSPSDAPWPGWLFYATTHCAPTNSWWRDLGALNAYITRCQSVLQTGEPDNDVLLYFPFYDLLASETGAVDGLQFLSFHRTKDWLRGSLPEFCRVARELWAAGWGFDYVSDRQLAEDVTADGTGLAARGGARYKTLLVAGCRRMPPETLERIAALAEADATVLFLGDLPDDVPGLADFDARRDRLGELWLRIGLASQPRRILAGSEIRTLLYSASVAREKLADHGLEFIRRRQAGGGGWVYFVSNPTPTDVDAEVALTVAARFVFLTDPMSGATGAAESILAPDGRTLFRLQISAGSSVIVEAFPTERTDGGGQWDYRTPDDGAVESLALAGEWHVTFVEGGPTLPAPRTISVLSDWTNWSDTDGSGADRAALRAFSGTARYTHEFDASAALLVATVESDMTLELGTVLHSARVQLNDADLGTVFARPWQVSVPPGLLKPTGNRLEIEVTNLMANRLGDLERREGEAWRPFLMVDIHYRGFDAATGKPLPSGLVGPARLLVSSRRGSGRTAFPQTNAPDSASIITG